MRRWEINFFYFGANLRFALLVSLFCAELNWTTFWSLNGVKKKYSRDTTRNFIIRLFRSPQNFKNRLKFSSNHLEAAQNFRPTHFSAFLTVQSQKNSNAAEFDLLFCGRNKITKFCIFYWFEAIKLLFNPKKRNKNEFFSFLRVDYFKWSRENCNPKC